LRTASPPPRRGLRRRTVHPYGKRHLRRLRHIRARISRPRVQSVWGYTVTGYGYGLAGSRDVVVAQTAPVAGLQLIREVMATAIRDDGGVPRTRRRPPHTNEAPGVHHAPGAAVPSANTRPDGRVAMPGPVSPEVSPDSVSPDSGGSADPGAGN